MTEQEDFWAGPFGTEYISRNNSADLLASNINFFANALKSMKSSPKNMMEIGANVGMNIDAIRSLFPFVEASAIEINNEASKKLHKKNINVFSGSITTVDCKEKYNLVLSKGVLIHIAPDMLNETYERIYELSDEWILIAEYYNPTPTVLDYRGHVNKLFKRDFAGEMLDKFPDLELWDYGFAYHRDKFAQDDISWFLLRKSN